MPDSTVLPDPDRIIEAAHRLAQGRLVAFPTETVYGLGADAENPAAIGRLYAAKRRPANHPVIVHLAPDVDPGYWAAAVPPVARQLMAAFWPGPLTLILPRAAHVPDVVSGGQDSIGLRCPSHPVAQMLLHAFATLKPHRCGGVAAPSANQFGRVSPTSASHVRREFPDLDAQALMILEGGESDVGIESTILDVSRLDRGVPPTLLRPGAISSLDLANVLGAVPARPDAQAPRASGSLKSHYAPRTPLVLIDDEQLARLVAGRLPGLSAQSGGGGAVQTSQGRPSAAVRDAAAQDVATQGGAAQDAAAQDDATPQDVAAVRGAGRTAVVVLDAPPAAAPAGIDWWVMARDPKIYAHRLYALLRTLDASGYERIVLQRPPTDAAWQGVNDRIGRAAAAFESGLDS